MEVCSKKTSDQELDSAETASELVDVHEGPENTVVEMRFEVQRPVVLSSLRQCHPAAAALPSRSRVTDRFELGWLAQCVNRPMRKPPMSHRAAVRSCLHRRR